MDEEHILEVTPMTFEEWKQTQPTPAEESVEEKVEE